MKSVQLPSAQFRKEREHIWVELEGLVQRLDKQGTRGLGTDELRRLPVLYRATLSSLSVAREISLDKNLVAYLEALSAKAYLAVYGDRSNGFLELWRFFSRKFPRLLWDKRVTILISGVVFLLGLAAGFLMVTGDPERYYSFISEEMAGGRDPSSSRKELNAVLHGGGSAGSLVLFASALFSHNARLGLLCYPLGFFGGVPVLLMLFTNGLSLGAMAAIYHRKGLDLEFWGWILPHGVTELFALVLCGAAGLQIAQALIFPGAHTRLESLAKHGRSAGSLAVGTVLMFLVAGLIEGIFRQSVHDIGIRYLVAAVGAFTWVAIIARGVQVSEQERAAEAELKGLQP